MTDDKKSLDILGIKPISDSISKVTQGSIDGASAFLSRICLPAAEEFGLLLRDKVSAWRSNNAIKITQKAQKIIENNLTQIVLHAHPRIVYSALEHGSWADNDFMQNLWAGLISSSCTPDGKDESNLIFINLLSQLTSSQGALINYICNNSNILASPAGWIQVGSSLILDIEKLLSITSLSDLHQLDRELDHLRSLELITAGFNPIDTNADVTPTPFCLQFYVRCQGYVGSPLDYFNVKPVQPSI